MRRTTFVRATCALSSAALALALALAASGPQRARAQEAAPAGGVEEEARMHFQLGRRYYDTGRFADAAAEFEQAYRLAPLDELLYNIYLAYRDLGDDARAAEVLRRYVATLAPGSERHAQLAARLEVLEARLADPSSATDDDAEDDDELAPVAPRDGGGAEDAASVEERRDGGGGMGVAPWIVAGSGAALLAGALVTGLVALDAQSSLDAMCATPDACPPGFEDVRSRGEALAITTDVLWIAGAATAVTGIVLAIVDASGGDAADERTTAGIGCDASGCAASVRGTF